MADDFRRIFYGVLIGFVVMIVLWVGFLTFSGCGSSLNCALAGPTAERTMIPTLVPGTLPPVNLMLGAAGPTGAVSGTPGASPVPGSQVSSNVPRPSNPGGPGPAVDLTGSVEAGKQIFSANCAVCHGADGKGGNPNPGSDDGTVPALNPIDAALRDPDDNVFRTNIDLFIEHGSTPQGPGPTFSMPAWGDKQLLAPQQIADVMAYVVSLNPAGAASKPTGTTAVAQVTATATVSAATEAPSQQASPVAEGAIRPSNSGGPGQAVELTGDANSGQQIFSSNCAVCHGADGKGGNPNPGATEGTVPALNPVKAGLKSPDYKTFATNLDLFIEHGSTPAGPGPTFTMPAWGDKKLLTPQQIADVIAYIIGLNP